jgi:ketol-acid reductoisomerase
MLVFAHGTSVHFGAVVPPSNVDVVLIAPLGPGKRLQELYNEKPGVACFFGVHQDYSGQAQRTGLAVAKAIGCLFSGAIQTTFAEEAVGDLFGEQAVLCGGFARLLKFGFDTLVDNGLEPEKAYLECVYQIDLIVDLIKTGGIEGMLARISHTAAWGAIQNGPRVLGNGVRKDFDTVYREVESGTFYAELLRRRINDDLDSSALTDSRFEQAAQNVRDLLTDRGKRGDKT